MIEVNLLEQVEGFYASAWDKLLLSGALVFAVLVIVFPILFYALNFKMIIAKLKERLNVIKVELVADIRKENSNELMMVKQDFQNKAKALKSMSLHLEAKSLLADGKIELATANFLEALKGYLQGKDFVNFRLLCNLLIDKCLPQLNKAQLIQVFKRIDTTEDDYFSELKKIDTTEYARPEIIELRLQMEIVEPAPLL
ncbi:hypothetical protein FACS1894156_4180 [Bacteroidia bacterium]|nr:hypothetical protein FACS1894156_4180 [Bacteroidia bacterium]